MFTVASAGDSVVLVNITTGKSWLLLRSADKAREPVFVPIEQLNTEDEVHTWHALEESVATRHENSVEPTRSTTGDFKRHSFSWLAGRISHADAADFFIHYNSNHNPRILGCIASVEDNALIVVGPKTARAAIRKDLAIRAIELQDLGGSSLQAIKMEIQERHANILRQMAQVSLSAEESIGEDRLTLQSRLITLGAVLKLIEKELESVNHFIARHETFFDSQTAENVTLDNGLTRGAESHQVRFAAPAEGVIMQLNEPGSVVVEISVGSDDGLKCGDIVVVSRNQKRIGKLRIAKCESDVSQAVIISLEDQEALLTGDHIAKNSE